MKKIFLLCLLIAGFSVKQFAHNPVINPFSLFTRSGFMFQNLPKSDFLGLAYDCKRYDYNDKRTEKNKKKYEKLCQKYPDDNNVVMCLFGMYYLRSENKDTNFNDGFTLLKTGLDNLSNVNQTFINGMNAVMGLAYLKGLGTEQDFKRGFDYYMKAVSDEAFGVNNEPYFYLYLPLFYCNILGIGTDVNEHDAIVWRNAFDDNPKVRNNDFADLKFNQINADIENIIYAAQWNKDNNIDQSVIDLFRNGIIKWYLNNDYEGAKDEFTKAIEKGHLPSMCELAMMYLDENWNQLDSKDQFEYWLKKAEEAGYIPATFIIALHMLEHWGSKSTFSSSNEGEAYPLFEQVSKSGFEPANKILALYEKGIYSKKTGLAAAVSDFVGGITDGGSPKDFGREIMQIINSYKMLISPSSSNNSGTQKSNSSQTRINTSSNNSGISINDDSSDTDDRTNTTNSSTSTINSSTKSKSKGETICKSCAGTGKIKCGWCHGDGREGCPGCNRKGYVYNIKCTFCNGSGTQRCSNCYGEGSITCKVCKGDGHY